MKINRRQLFGIPGFVPAVPALALALKQQETKPEVSSPAPLLPLGAPEWRGANYHGVTVDALIQSEFPNPRDWPSWGERAAAQKFYDGEQWDPEILKRRTEQGRPTLVLNQLSSLVALLVSNDDRRWLYPERMTLVVTAVVRQNRDAQVLHNYLASTAAEWNQVNKATLNAVPTFL
jgi:hypothetical protein